MRSNLHLFKMYNSVHLKDAAEFWYLYTPMESLPHEDSDTFCTPKASFVALKFFSPCDPNLWQRLICFLSLRTWFLEYYTTGSMSCRLLGLASFIQGNGFKILACDCMDHFATIHYHLSLSFWLSIVLFMIISQHVDSYLLMDIYFSLV